MKVLDFNEMYFNCDLDSVLSMLVEIDSNIRRLYIKFISEPVSYYVICVDTITPIDTYHALDAYVSKDNIQIYHIDELADVGISLSDESEDSEWYCIDKIWCLKENTYDARMLKIDIAITPDSTLSLYYIYLFLCKHYKICPTPKELQETYGIFEAEKFIQCLSRYATVFSQQGRYASYEAYIDLWKYKDDIQAICSYHGINFTWDWRD